MLTAKNIVMERGSSRVLDDVSFTLGDCEVVALLGANGSGKTTLFQILTGSLAPLKGRVEIDGVDVTDMHIVDRANRGLSYLPQEPSLFRGLTVEQNIVLVLEANERDRRRRHERLELLLRTLGIDSLRKSYASSLSGGERRKCEIARALATHPRFLLLDEPFAGIDPIAVSDLKALIRVLAKLSVSVLITDHNVRDSLSIVDRAYVIHSGRLLAAGSVAQVTADERVRRLYLNRDFRL